MSSKKTIAVIGATGLQGGSVARFLIEDGEFIVRAITRNPDSPAAKALVKRGAEVVRADATDVASLIAAFTNAYGVFGVTNYWDPIVGAAGERTQGKALVDAARQTGVQHFVWSTLDHSEYKAEHWESKAYVDMYLKESGVPRTSLYTSFYYENFTNILKMEKDGDDGLDFTLRIPPDIPIACYSVPETGAWVLEAFKNTRDWLGQDMRIASEFISLREMARIISDVSGKRVNIRDVTIDLTPPDHVESSASSSLEANMKVLLRYNSPPFRDPALTRRIYPKTTTFRKWVMEHVNEIVA